MSDEQSSGEAMEADLRQAVADVVAKHAGSMATKWAMAVETVNAEGTRGLWSFKSEGITPWDHLGLLMYSMELEKTDMFHG